MIALRNVFDRPLFQGRRLDVAHGVNLLIPSGHYALLAEDQRLRRPALDLLAGLRPPRSGSIFRNGTVSWPIGRAGFVRARAKGSHLIALIARLYGLDLRLCEAIIAELLSDPGCLAEPVDHWESSTRQEFLHAIGLLPDFDIYIVDGTLPVANARFTEMHRALFEKKIDGRTLILLTTRPSEIDEYCDRALVLRNGQIEIHEELDEAVLSYPPRPVGGERRVDADLFDVDQAI